MTELEVHLSPNFAPTTHLVLRPARKAGHDRQATPCGVLRPERAGVRHGAPTSSIANAQEESVLDELNLHVDPITLAASVTDRVRDELARHQQRVLHVLPVDPASAECSS